MHWFDYLGWVTLVVNFGLIGFNTMRLLRLRRAQTAVDEAQAAADAALRFATTLPADVVAAMREPGTMVEVIVTRTHAEHAHRDRVH